MARERSSWTEVQYVRFGSLADICSAKRHVRFTPKSGHKSAVCDLSNLMSALRMATGRSPTGLQYARSCAAKRRLDDAARIDADSVGVQYPEPGYLLIGATSEAWRCAF